MGGFSFYQRAEIKDMVAYLKLAASNSDSVSLLRVINTPARGIGRTTVEQIERYAREHGLSLWDAIERIIDDEQLSTRSQSSLVMFRNLIQELSLVASSLAAAGRCSASFWTAPATARCCSRRRRPNRETRLENLDELINAAAEAAERGETLGDFLDHAALVAEADAFDERAPVTPDDAAQRQGAGVPGGVSLRAWRWDCFRTAARWIPKRRSKRSGGCATWA